MHVLFRFPPRRGWLSVFVLAPLSALPPAFAQSVLDPVVVTGTRAKDRTLLTSSTPVDVLSADELRRAAGTDGTLTSALAALLPSFNFPRQSNSSGADHVRAAQLRGLNPDQVLLLVNGKRRHVSAVVNLDSKLGKGTNPADFASIPLNAVLRVEVLRDGAGAQYGSDAIAGVVNVILDGAAEGGEIEASTGAYRTRFAPTGERVTDGEQLALRAKAGLASKGGEARVRFGIQASTQKPTQRAGLDEIPFFEDQTPDNLALAGRQNYRAGEPKVNGFDLWANGSTALPGGAEAYAFATLNQRRTVGAAFFRYPDGAANVRLVYPNGYRPETTGDNQDLQAVAGWRGSLPAGWDLDASAAYGANRFDYGVRNSLNASLGAASPTSFDLGRFRFDQWVLSADATRELRIDGLAKPLLLALGAEVRREGYATAAGDPASYAAGGAGGAGGAAGAQAGPGLQPQDEADLSRSVAGVYVDLGGDLAPGLNANAALRHDRYGDFGGATTGKLSARWAFAPDVALRGSVSSNFRAPSLAQRAFSFTVTGFGDGGALTQVRLVPVDTAIARSLGARDLKAETSRNATLGLTLRAGADTTVSLDAYRIDVDDRITLSQRFAVGTDSYNFFTNAVDTRTRGADLVAEHATRLAGAPLRLNVAVGTSKTTIRSIDAGAGVGLEEINTLTDAAPRERLVLAAAWQPGAWNLSTRITRHGRTTRVFDFGGGFTPTQTYGARWQLDAEAEWRVAPGVTVALGGLNVTDKYPDRSIADISYFGNLPYDVLSPVGFNGAFWYARLRYSF